MGGNQIRISDPLPLASDRSNGSHKEWEGDEMKTPWPKCVEDWATCILIAYVFVLSITAYSAFCIGVIRWGLGL